MEHLARAIEWDTAKNELVELNNKYSVFALFISIVAVMGSLLRNMSSYGYGFLGTRAKKLLLPQQNPLTQAIWVWMFGQDTLWCEGIGCGCGIWASDKRHTGVMPSVFV